MAEVVVPEPQGPVDPLAGPSAGAPPDDGPPGPVERLRFLLAARAVRAVAPEPESWLDVNCGGGHFCAAAKAYFPYTAFDGLDVTPLVEVALAAGRVEEAHRGLPDDPAVAALLTGRYDVVSLRGVRPRPDVLRALRALLRPDGHLLLDPAPTCPGDLVAAGYRVLPPRPWRPWQPLLARAS
ncbi:methyltransferase domain-containing protein [Streptomyces sp. NPDC002640]